MKNELRQTRELLDRSASIALLGHVRPDGDTIGSTLALCLSLLKLGKDAAPVFSEGISGRFEFLPGAERIRPDFPGGFECIIALDTSNIDRIGVQLPAGRAIDINIDHHPSNTEYAAINLVDPDAASTTELLWQISAELGLPIDEQVATNLLVGLITDTLGFRTQSTRQVSMQMAAELMEFRVDWAELYRKAFIDRSYQAVRYWGCGLSDLNRRDGVVWASLSLQDRASVGYTGWDDGDLIDVLTTIQDAQIAVVFVEQPEGKTKVSWRARGNLDVAAIAARFGGGGHTVAAGAMIEGELEEIQPRVINETLSLIVDLRSGPHDEFRPHDR